MRVVILYDAANEGGAPADAADALVQAALVRTNLEAMGHSVRQEPVTVDLAVGERAAKGADLVFNLVESLGGKGSQIHLVPARIEAIGTPMTGCPARAIEITSDKLAAKRIMRAEGLATPDWIDEHAAAPGSDRWIIKSVWEHASIGISGASIVDGASTDVHARLASARGALGGDVFAERFVDGREFNISVLEVDGEPVVLPPAEIEFVGFGADRPRIVGYAAKWDDQSYEYHHTPRKFDVASADAGLVDRLRELVVRCWRVFGLRGYARVDFRIDAHGTPWILEINTNPCLSADAGFMAAAERAGLSHRDVIERIVIAAMRRERA